MIYFILAAELNRVKIGYTDRNPELRLKELQTATPSELEIIHVIEGNPSLEIELQKQFFAHRVHNEWFRYHEDIKSFIEADISKNSKTFSLGQLLEARRKAMGLSQTDMAKILGVGQAAVSKYELNDGLLVNRKPKDAYDFLKVYGFKHEEIIPILQDTFSEYAFIFQGSGQNA